MLYEVQIQPHSVLCVYSGVVNLQDFLDAIKQYLTHPDCGAFTCILHDFTKAESFSYAEESFSGLANYALENYQVDDYVPRCAITSNDSIRRSLELYAVLTGRPWHFVPNLAEARTWVSNL
jgi:hypothetical protein